MSIGHRILYAVARLLLTVVFRGFFRVRVAGVQHVPREGGLLIVSNHISFADPLLIGYFTPRPVDFMALVELFRLPVLGALTRAVGAFPVDRSRVDHAAAREAVRRLRAGRCVAIFPEGGIRLGPDSVLGGNPRFRPGAGTIGMLGGAAILPVVIRDARKTYAWRNWLRRETLSIRFGRPFCLWAPADLPGQQRRARARETLRDALLKTVELDD
jgi:1-acyl-sn-glycerol-3-phosphate acyltransferase